MNNGVMCDYFDYDGIRYYAGSKFKCNNFVKTNVQLFPEIEEKIFFRAIFTKIFK